MSENKKDMLESIFEMQSVFQESMGNNVRSQEFINQMALALCAEVFEALGETPWKPWKKIQSSNIENYKNEIVDIMAFSINLVLSSGMTPQEFYHRFKEKNTVNFFRQEHQKEK